jgi:zinc D-Ala-D-Ala carboxypeptidase
MPWGRPHRAGGVATALVAVTLLSACGGSTPSSTPPARASGPPDVAATRTNAEAVVPLAVARPAQPPLAAGFRTALVADGCVDRDLPAPPARSMALTILDRSYALPLDYVPPDLVPASAAGFDGPSGARLVSASMLDDLAAMRRAWTAAGLTITIDSGYRSAAAQAETLAGWVATLGDAAARQRTARPGHSEHQLGTALDLGSAGWAGRFGDWATQSAEGAWMSAHGWEFGFVMSYGAADAEVSCYGYEPWHYRWIGREPAAEHRQSGLALRRFLERYVEG